MYRGDPDDLEPAWVSNEREQFKDYRDKNNDGYLDEEEVSVFNCDDSLLLLGQT